MGVYMRRPGTGFTSFIGMLYASYFVPNTTGTSPMSLTSLVNESETCNSVRLQFLFVTLTCILT